MPFLRDLSADMFGTGPANLGKYRPEGGGGAGPTPTPGVLFEDFTITWNDVSGGTVTHVYSDSKTFDVTKTLPLATHGASGRFAILYVSSQGSGQSSAVLTDPEGWTSFLDLEAGDPSNAHRPRMWGFYRELTDSMTDQTLIHSGVGGWTLVIFDGTPTFGSLVSDYEFGYGTSQEMDAPGTGNGVRVGVMASNSLTTVTPPATAVPSNKAYYSNIDGSYEINASFTSGTTPSFTTAAATDYTMAWVFVPTVADSLDPVYLSGTFDSTIAPSNDPGQWIHRAKRFQFASDPTGAEFTIELDLTCVNNMPSTKGANAYLLIKEDDETTVLARTEIGDILANEGTKTLSGTFNMSGSTDLVQKIRVEVECDDAENVRPTIPTASGTTYITAFNTDIPDWWEYSNNVADTFKLVRRANGPVRYASPSGAGAHDGTSAADAWSGSELWTEINAGNLASNTLVHMAAGNYGNLGQLTGKASTDPGDDDGWITLLGPADSSTPAHISGDYYRYWSMGAGSGKMQFIRLKAEQTALNSAFYATPSTANSDGAMATALGGTPQSSKDPGCVGFQMDGWSTPHPYKGIYVNCVAIGHGEGFGSYKVGSMFLIGCVAYETAIASPNGRSSVSISRSGDTSANVCLTLGGINFKGGMFGCVAGRSFQLTPSSGIGLPSHLTDGNALNGPTDALDGDENGNYLIQSNVFFASSGGGLNAYNLTNGGDKCYFVANTIVGNGANINHRAGSSPFYQWGTTTALPTSQTQVSNGRGPAIIVQKYTSGVATTEVSNNIALKGYDTASLWVIEYGDAQGKGNVFDGSVELTQSSARTGTNSATYATAGASAVLLNPDVSGVSDNFDPRPKPGSVAESQGYKSELILDLDIRGEAYTERGTGRCNAGAFGR